MWHVGGLGIRVQLPNWEAQRRHDGTRARQRMIALLHHAHLISGGNDDAVVVVAWGLALSMKAAAAPVTNAVKKSEV